MKAFALSRHTWITEFIGHVLRTGLSSDPDRVCDCARELYSDWGSLDPDIAADSTFGRPAPARHGRRRGPRRAARR